MPKDPRTSIVRAKHHSWTRSIATKPDKKEWANVYSLHVTTCQHKKVMTLKDTQRNLKKHQEINMVTWPPWPLMILCCLLALPHHLKSQVLASADSSAATDSKTPVKNRRLLKSTWHNSWQVAPSTTFVTRKSSTPGVQKPKFLWDHWALCRAAGTPCFPWTTRAAPVFRSCSYRKLLVERHQRGQDLLLMLKPMASMNTRYECNLAARRDQVLMPLCSVGHLLLHPSQGLVCLPNGSMGLESRWGSCKDRQIDFFLMIYFLSTLFTLQIHDMATLQLATTSLILQQNTKLNPVPSSVISHTNQKVPRAIIIPR